MLVAVIIDPYINALVDVRPDIVNVYGAIVVIGVNGFITDTTAEVCVIVLL
jgi:hypothetical protein